MSILLHIHRKRNYYLQMEDGGVSLFDFVKKAHRFIQCGQLKLTEWHKVVRVLTKQMIECVSFLHSLNVVHFDISLENWLINDVQVEVDSHQSKCPKLRFVTADIQIKLCDFGRCRLFSYHINSYTVILIKKVWRNYLQKPSVKAVNFVASNGTNHQK